MTEKKEIAKTCSDGKVCAQLHGTLGLSMESHKGILLGQAYYPMIWKVETGIHEFKVILSSLHGGQPGIHETETLYEKNINKIHLFLKKIHCLLVY